MNAVHTLRRQHESLLEAFDELDITVETEPRIVLLAHIGLRLKAQSAAEDAVIYPVVGTSDEGAALVASLRDDQVAIDTLLDEVVGAGADPERVAVLRERVERHYAVEERSLFPRVEQLDERARRRCDRALTAYLGEFGDGTDDALAPVTPNNGEG